MEIDGRFFVENLDFQDDKLDPLSDDQLVALRYDAAISHLRYEANLIFLVLNITRPGSISAVKGFSFVNGERFGSTKPFFASDLYEAVAASRKIGWPKFINLSFCDTWRWLAQSGALAEGMGVTALGHAIAALSQLTSENLLSTNSMNLVWILLGLEALYSTGAAGMKEQLIKKTEVFLGPRKENKKAFGTVYDFRSRLLHGDVDIPLRFSEYDAVKKYEQFHRELYQNENLALAVLVATLQGMASRNSYLINFRYEFE